MYNELDTSLYWLLDNCIRKVTSITKSRVQHLELANMNPVKASIQL